MIPLIEKLFQEHVTLEWLKKLRREFHMWPEVSGEEHQTMRRITSLLDAWGVEYVAPVAQTGVMAILRGNRPGLTVALRSDMDALPIEERNDDISYASRNKGVMHACGHDAHMTILLGTIKLLLSLNGDFAGNIKCFFQPAEERIGGAKRMIQEGVLENPHVDRVIALHVMPEHPTGTVKVRYGNMYATTDSFLLKVMGRSSHGATPDEGVDAILVASHIVVAAQSIVSRAVSPLDAAVITFGTVHGGGARNQVAEEVQLEGILRTVDHQTRRIVHEKLRTLTVQVAEAMGAVAVIEIHEGHDPLINDDRVTDIIYQNAQELLGKENVSLLQQPRMNAEDFAFFASARPGSYYHLGGGFRDREMVPLHNSRYTFDEDCLEIGVKLQALNALRLLEE
jgi:amidohydrolase